MAKEKKVKLGEFEGKAPDKSAPKAVKETANLKPDSKPVVKPDDDLAPEKPASAMSFKKSEEPLVLVMDTDKVEEWLVHGHLRIRGVFDRAEITGEGLENKDGRTGVPGMVVSMAIGALKPGGIVVMPEHLASLTKSFEVKPAEAENKPGFLAFSK